MAYSVGRIEGGKIPQAEGRSYDVRELLGGDDRYEGGDYAVLYLSPRDYHIVHVPREGTAPPLPAWHRTRRRRFLSAPSSSRPLTIAAVMNTVGGGAHDALAVTAARNPRRVLMTGFRTIKAIRRWLTTPATADFRRPGRFRLMLVPAADCPQRSFSLMVRWQPLVRLATRCDNRGCRCPSRSPPTLPT